MMTSFTPAFAAADISADELPMRTPTGKYGCSPQSKVLCSFIRQATGLPEDGW